MNRPTSLFVLSVLAVAACRGDQQPTAEPALALASSELVSFCGQRFEPDSSWVTCADKSVTDLSPLSRFASLERVDLIGLPDVDLSPLSKHVALAMLDLSGTAATNLSPLAALGALEELSLKGCPAADFSPLSSLAKLTKVKLSHTSVADVAVLRSASQLKALSLDHTKVEKVLPLQSFTKLEWLDLRGVSASDIDTLAAARPSLEILRDIKTD